MPTGSTYMRPWNELIEMARKRAWSTRPWQPPRPLEHRMVLSLSRNGNGLLNVRCECMAGTVNKRPGRYYNYDTLGERLNFEQARDLYAAHLAAKGDDHEQDDLAGAR